MQVGATAGNGLAGTYPNPSIGPNAVGTSAVANDSLTGNDINENTLSTVPSATVADDATPYAFGQVNADGTLGTSVGTSQNIASVSKGMDPSAAPYTGVLLRLRYERHR